MARNGINIAMRNQILALKLQGKGIRSIAEALGISRNTVRSILRQSPRQASDIPATAVPLAAVEHGWLAVVNWPTVVQLRKNGRTIKQLHADHGPQDVSYWAFRRALEGHLGTTPKPALRLDHKAGERTYVDYADGPKILNPETGEVIKTHLFCGVLPFSAKTFGEFVLDQKLPSFLASHERMWAYFGGVTPYVVSDNLKSAVTKAHLYDPDVNPTYCEFANHCGFAVLPARPYTPRDKAAVEAAIGVIQKTFYQEIADRIFTSLAELNQVFRAFLERLNSQVMKDYGVSRNDRFSEEKPHLLPLPAAPFVITEWKEVKVHPDCHVQVQKNFYSVPHPFIGRGLRARITAQLVEIFTDDLALVATHARLAGTGRYATLDAHLPEQAMQAASFEIRSQIAFAKGIGPKTHALAEQLLIKDPRPLRRLRLFQGLNRLIKDGRVTKEAMEYGVSQALTFQRYRLAYVTSCAQSFMQRGPRPNIVAPRREAEHIHLHGGTL